MLLSKSSSRKSWSPMFSPIFSNRLNVKNVLRGKHVPKHLGSRNPLVFPAPEILKMAICYSSGQEVHKRQLYNL
jgi:hypothetical protein